MSLVTQIKRELNQLGIKPKKSLGQNFLINEGIYKKIITALELKPNDTVVEVGPGLGTLTKFLSESATEVIAIEKDHQLIQHLKTKFVNQKNVRIIEGDVLNFQFSIFNFQKDNYKIAGNIPYYLTSHLLRVIFERWPKPKLIALMLQKEVAQRIIAKPPKMSLLAVSVQYYTKPKVISYVSRGSFYPAPEVDSAIIRLVPSFQFLASRSKEESKNYKLEPGNFFKVVQAGFAKKRKQLVNNLSIDLKTSREKTEELLSSVGIDPKRRAETLTLWEWQKLTDTIFPPR